MPHLTLLLACLAAAASPRSAAATVIREGKHDKAEGENLVTSVMGSVPVLNRVTFRGNIQEDLAHVEHWMVMFCVEWYEPCRKVRQAYLDLASEHERKLNAKSLLTLPVRFAEVDCRVDKVLCNEQDVDWYPEIAHYHHGDMVSRWTVGDDNKKLSEHLENMTQFLKDELNFSMPESEMLDSKLDSNTTTDIWKLPMAQQHPAKTAIRMAPLAAALVGMVMWLCNMGAELLQALHLLRGERAAPAASDASKKPPQLALPRTSAEGLRQRLPESWRNRHSIEL